MRSASQQMHMISQHKDNKITKRELKDLALNKKLEDN